MITFSSGTKILVRTYSAGVHYGNLVAFEGKMVHLSHARRIWRWEGALTLNEIANSGVNVKASKISEPVKEIILTEAIEIIPISQKSNLP
jgi:hypothetical protein